VIRVVASIEGYRADAFAIPTGLFISLAGPGVDPPMIRMTRVNEWAVNLERLTLIDRIFNDVAEHRCSLEDARARLREVEKRPPPYAPPLVLLASAGACGAAAIFFRGGVLEMGIAALGGAILGVEAFALRRSLGLRLLSDYLGGLVAGLLAWGFTWLRPDLSREVLVLSVVIPLVPGMALTTALDELAHKNLVSGAARLMEAMMVFLSILFGIASAVGLEQWLGFVPPPAAAGATRELVGVVWQVPALLVAAVSFAVLFSVPRRFIAAAILSGAVGWIATELGTHYLPSTMSALLASLLLCCFANAFARFTERPAQLFLLPGLVLLVPGSFGFRSLEEFLRGDYVNGAARGFEMFLIAGALVTGILFANVLLPAKKIL
jgi:uncharacterized membrane protein YjjP (DUF1212 family)